MNIVRKGSSNCDPEVKVTRIVNKWHARLIYKGVIIDEMACSDREDIGWICREMLRWFDKAGGCSEFAAASRKRQTSTPLGHIWYKMCKQQ